MLHEKGHPAGQDGLFYAALRLLHASRITQHAEGKSGEPNCRSEPARDPSPSEEMSFE
jgi:hypothetical protein